MKKFLEFFADLIMRLSSRKFILTFIGILAVVQFPEQSAAICALIATFTGAEGAADVVQRYADSKKGNVSAAVTDTLNALANDEDTYITGADPVPGSTDTTTTGEAPL
mgnify:CR=1 FL=1